MVTVLITDTVSDDHLRNQYLVLQNHMALLEDIVIFHHPIQNHEQIDLCHNFHDGCRIL